MSGPQNESQAAEFLADCEPSIANGTSARRPSTREGCSRCTAKTRCWRAPLVPAILDDKPDGVLRGHEELRHFFEQGGRRRPNDLVRWYRTGDWLTDGRRLLVWNIRGKRQMAIR
jgi:hypothetical protein